MLQPPRNRSVRVCVNAKPLTHQEAMNVATVLRDNGLLRGRAEFVHGGTVVVPVAIRKDVTPSELAQALKETQPDVSSDTLMAIGSSPAKLENGRVLLEFVFELGTTALNFQHALNDTASLGALKQLTSNHRRDSE